jgi:hypothetical protein
MAPLVGKGKQAVAIQELRQRFQCKRRCYRFEAPLFGIEHGSWDTQQKAVFSAWEIRFRVKEL